MTLLSSLVTSIKKDNTNTEKALKSLKYNPASRKFEMKFPVIEHWYKDSDLQERLANTCRRIGDEQKRKTNVKADMTGWFMHETDSDFEMLCAEAMKLANENSPSEVALMQYDCWGAIYNKGDWTKNHDHWPQIWSWVYNVKCCDDCAPLIFHDSRNEEDTDHAFSLKPSNGKITMFPGWVKHSVSEQQCEHERIIVAGNISANPYHIISGIKEREERKIYFTK